MAHRRPPMHVVGVAFPVWFFAADESPGPAPRLVRSNTPERSEPDVASHPADVPVIAGIRAGDPATFRTLYTNLYAELATFALTITHSRDLADDAVQLAMTRLWLSRDRFAPASTVRAYLFTAVRRNALEVMRRDRHIAAAETVAGDVERDAIPAPDAAIEANEWSRAIGRAVAALPPRARTVFLLSRRFSLSHQEIAAILGLSVNTVANHMGRALQGLSAAVERLSATDLSDD